MAESAEVGSGTMVSTELSDPIRSHQDIDQDAVPFYHKAVKFGQRLALVVPLWFRVLILIAFAPDPVVIAVMVVGIAVKVVGIAVKVRIAVTKVGIAEIFHRIKIFLKKDLVVEILRLVVGFNWIMMWSSFARAIWRYLLSFQFMRSLCLQLHLPWTFEFRLPLIFGFQRPWTIPAFGIDFLEQIFTNDPAGAPPTWVFDTVVVFNTAFLLFGAGLWVYGIFIDSHEKRVREAGAAGSRSKFKFPIVQGPLEIPGGSPSWMQRRFVTLEKIAIWERPVENLTLFYRGGKRKGSGVFKHDYIVIKLACGEFFTAEKVAKGDSIQFTRGNGTQTGVTPTCRFSMELKGATVPVVKLGHVLGKKGSGYHLLWENCWLYAFEKTQGVIELCGRDPNLVREKRASLLKGLERLKKAERTDPDLFVILGGLVLAVLFLAVNMAIIGVSSEYKPEWLRWLRRLLQCDRPYWNPHSKLT